jgi:limonene-1,2-epoxide hydrolase
MRTRSELTMILAMEPHGATGNDAISVHDSVEGFIDAFNDGDVEAMIGFLDPEVELHTMRGLCRGHDGARTALTREPGGVQPALRLDEIHLSEACGGTAVLAFVTRQWRWVEDGSAAGEPEEMAFLFERRNGKVSSWRPFADRDEGQRLFERKP